MKQNQSQAWGNIKHKIWAEQQNDAMNGPKLNKLKARSKQIKNQMADQAQWELLQIPRSTPDVLQAISSLDVKLQQQRGEPFSKKVSQYQQLDLEELSLTSDVQVPKLERKQEQKKELQNKKYNHSIKQRFQRVPKVENKQEYNQQKYNYRQQNEGLILNEIKTQQIELKAHYKIQSFMQFQPGRLAKTARMKKQQQQNGNNNYNPQNHLLQIFQQHKKLSKIKESQLSINKQKIIADAKLSNKRKYLNTDKDKYPELSKNKLPQNMLKCNIIKSTSPYKTAKQPHKSKDKQIVNITFYLNDEIVQQSFVKKMTFFKNQYLEGYDVFYDKQMKIKVKQKMILVSKNADFYCQPKYELMTNFAKTNSYLQRTNTFVDKNEYDLHFSDYKRALSNDFEIKTKKKVRNKLAQIEQQDQLNKYTSKLAKHKSTKNMHGKQKQKQQNYKNENKIFNIKKKPKLFIEQLPTDLYNQQGQQKYDNQSQLSNFKNQVSSTLQNFTQTVGDLRKSFYHNRITSSKQYQNTYSLKKLSKADKLLKQCHNYEQMMQLRNYLHRSRVKA